MKAVEKHRREAPKSVRVSLITISSSRFNQLKEKGRVKDESGDVAESLVRKVGHQIVSRTLVDDDPEKIRFELLRVVYETDSNAIFLMGGTGLARKDVTIETVAPLFEKAIIGFGETLRVLSYRKIGPAAILTRAAAGTISGKVVFCVPGSPDAVRTALSFVLPELAHAVYIAEE